MPYVDQQYTLSEPAKLMSFQLMATYDAFNCGAEVAVLEFTKTDQIPQADAVWTALTNQPSDYWSYDGEGLTKK